MFDNFEYKQTPIKPQSTVLESPFMLASANAQANQAQNQNFRVVKKRKTRK
jgi:hypothetical protein